MNLGPYVLTQAYKATLSTFNGNINERGDPMGMRMLKAEVSERASGDAVDGGREYEISFHVA